MTLASRAYTTRIAVLAALVLLGFWLRVRALDLPDLNIDETWSFLQTHGFIYPPNGDSLHALRTEPNNALHLFLASFLFRFVPTDIGLRFLSVLLGTLTVALVARIAYRLYGRRAAPIAALLMALAMGGVVYAQLGRPYALATILALMALLFTLENRWRLAMLFGALAPFAHVGAMPVVMAADALSLWELLRGKKRLKWGQWIISRIVVYGMFVLIVLLAYSRRSIGMEISSGQGIPTAAHILANLFNLLHGIRPADTVIDARWHDWFFVAAVAVPLLFLVALVIARRGLRRSFALPLLWVGLTYGALIVMAAFSNGPIKFLHITHVAAALVLLMTGVMVAIPAQLRWALVAAFCVANAASLVTYYTVPDHRWTDTAHSLIVYRANSDDVYYVQQLAPAWALQLNVPATNFFAVLPPETARPASYKYLAHRTGPPFVPPECDAEPVWQHGDYHLHVCAP